MNSRRKDEKSQKKNHSKKPRLSRCPQQRPGGSSDGERGRGGNSGRGNEGGRHYRENQQQQQQQQNKANQIRTFKCSGEKGAEVHTVSEDVRIRFTKIMLSLRENDNVDSIEMPSDLSNTERKFLHVLAAQLGLKSKSSGKGEDRRITITKMKKKGNSNRSDVNGSDLNSNDLNLPLLQLGEFGMNELALYLSKFPPTQLEEAEATETGSSLWNKRSQDANEHKDNDQESDQILLKTLEELKIESETKSPITVIKQKHANQVNVKKRQAIYHALQRARIQHPDFAHMEKVRAKLPAHSYQNVICDIIRKNTVTILSGDTGCGKSTQVPQFILDDPDIGPSCSIVVTQPRRISAISIAERISSERCEEVGNTVGYNVRLESCSSNKTQLLFVTPGVLLRKFQSDPELGEFTHIIIDEIHERDRYTEFLMIALRELLNRRSDLSVVLMSATIQTNELMDYWSSAGSLYTEDMILGDGEHRPAEINIPGRTYPVQEFFLEDVLTMTGFVNDASGYFVDVMDDLEANLASIINSRNLSGNSQIAQSQQSYQSTLSCIMCNKAGFRSPEELGSHVALCTGGGDLSAVALEEKVRGAALPVQQMKYDSETYFEEEIGTIEAEQGMQLNEDEIEEMLGVKEGRWDGESPFAVADNLALGNKTTLTDEEMLNRYQTIHDDEQIDDELVLEVIKYICKSSYGDGAILIFLPGWQEISELMLLLENTAPFSDKSKFSVLPLHSGIPSKEQRFVFQKPRQGVRKIVMATNIAETSITIDDVAFVIDSGRAKEKNYDPHLKSSTLQPVWISKASAKQRKGRAGRTKAGVCFHLYSRRRHDSLREFLDSELLRTSLEEIVLQCKKLHLAPGGPDDDDGVPAFLSAALTPPHPKSVTNALELLVDMGAIDSETNDLTQLGNCLSMLSLEPRVGKMLIWSYIIGCVKDASGMAVAMSYKNPFILPPPTMRHDAEKKQIQLSNGTESDQITILNVLNTLDDLYVKGKGSQFYGYCKRHYINTPTINIISDLRKNISRELKSIGFGDPNDLNSWYNRNRRKQNTPFLQAAIAAGLYPNIASRQKGEMNFLTLSNQKAKIHLSSVNSCKAQPLSKKAQMLEYVAYGELVKGITSYTLNQTTHLASAAPLLLLCGNFRIRPAYVHGQEVEHVAVVSTDEGVICQCDKDAAFALAVLRRRLDSIVMHIVSNPTDGMKSLDDIEWKALSTVDAVIKSAFQSSPGRM